MVEPTLSQRILCVDDSPALRDGLRTLITLEPDLEWVGAAADGEEGVRLTERLQPDVVILDIDMPGLSGLEVARRIRARRPGTRIVVFTGEPTWRARALAAEADAFVLKGAPAADLIEAIRSLPSPEPEPTTPSTSALPALAAMQQRAAPQHSAPILVPSARIVVEPVTTFEALNRVVQALETLAGLRDLRPHHFHDARLEIAAEDDAPTPLGDRLRVWRDLGAFASVEEAPDEVIIRLR